MNGKVNNDRYICRQDNTTVVQRYQNNIPSENSTSIFDKKQNYVEPLEINGEHSFDTKTSDLFGRWYEHKTKLLDIAQSMLGLVEVTPDEYKKLTPAQREKTQMKIVGEMGGGVDHQWCAYTVSYMAEKAGMNIGGRKAQVSQFISWAKKNGTYKTISSNPINIDNMQNERANRASQIKAQIPQMHEGDFIIWKNDYATRTDQGIDTNMSSHIGIIETVDLERGKVTVIEGNANESLDPYGPVERIEITTKNKSTLGVNGNQIEDEYQEVNRRDGLIRKEYSINDLANFGYSGYIDNSEIVK